MDAAAAVVRVKRIQAAFKVLVILQLTAIYWPQQAIVPDGARYDYVIVGAGSAGCVIANRLTEDPHVKVLLIEAGGDPPFETMLPGLLEFIPQTAEDWNITEKLDKNRKKYQNSIVLPLTQGKMLGGGSSANYMWYVRGNARDYQRWADLAKDQSWNYSNVLPYFKKSEYMEDPEILNSESKKFHGTNGYLHVTREPHPELKVYLDMFHELGHKILLDPNGDDPLGYSQPSFTISDGVRQSTAYSFLRPVKNRQNLHVLKRTLVTKILFDDFKNAIGVQALTEDRKTITIMADKEVIVTAGGLNSPKLLMLSGIGPKAHLKSFSIKTISDLPVGENLQDHAGSLVVYKFKKSNEPSEPPNYEQFPISAIGGYIALNKSENYPTYQAIVFAIPHDSPGPVEFCSFNFALDYNVCQAIYEAGKGRDLLFNVVNLLNPESRGTVQLRSTNPKDNPVVSLGSYSVESDLDKMTSSLTDFDKIRTSSYFKSVGGEFVDHKLPKCGGLAVGSREYWRCHVLSTKLTMYHYSGACALGSVLDARLRVRGVRRLRVADSSAMPAVPSGNINAPVIMLAEKAADLIKEDNN